MNKPDIRNFRNAKRYAIQMFEIEFLRDLMVRSAGNVTQAAIAAGLQRSTLQRLMRKHMVKSADYRSSEPGPLPTERGTRTAEVYEPCSKCLGARVCECTDEEIEVAQMERM